MDKTSAHEKDTPEVREEAPSAPPSPASPPLNSSNEMVSDDEDFEDAHDDAHEPSSPRLLTKTSASPLKPAEGRQTSSEPESPISDDMSYATGGKTIDYFQEAKATTDSDDDDKSDDESTQSTSNRLSNTSNLDNVSLDDEAASRAVDDTKPTEKEQSSKSLSLSSITNSLPAMPWSPQAETSPTKSSNPPLASVAPPLPPPSQPQPPTRKLTSPFSWLSRNSTSKDKEPPAPASALPSPRRNTASSVATLASNPEMMLSRLEEGEQDPNRTRNSLKDRFKMLRMREEVGVIPSSLTDDGEVILVSSAATPGDEKPAEEQLASPTVPQPSDSLAPGTVSGVNAGPSAMPDPQVDWDLWQSVVYEGPAAVARTSAEELNRAIATGIPSAIRGVIWQVLAESKNDSLEFTYRRLAAKGTDKEKEAEKSGARISIASTSNGSTQAGEKVTSSASSVQSDHSGGNSQASPQTEKSVDAAMKTQTLSADEQKKKDKEDAATLQKLEKVIRRDLGARTSYSKYAAASGLQDGLFGVCKAYALYDEGVGYAQGMNFLIMPLLFNMPEQEAFCLLVRLMNQYGLRDLFIQDMPGLHMRLYQFERLLEDHEPALYCHLHRRGISPHLYATQWFLTLFAYRFPLQLVLRIYDLILSEGLSAILRFGIVLMQKNASILLGISDMQQLTMHLKDKLFDVYIDKDPSQGSLLESGFFGSSSSSADKEVYRADQLVRDACEIKITPEVLKAYTTEWEEKTTAEKDRENELHDLRVSNQNFAIQMRKLEERVEVCDREQAGLATELVHTKVENEELKDENESLKGQVRELRVVIEHQPQEIEAKWNLERDDLIKRNEKVHEENQRLEKELADLEEQLVQTKMRYAEINSQHETLNRKWSDLKRQFA